MANCFCCLSQNAMVCLAHCRQELQQKSWKTARLFLQDWDQDQDQMFKIKTKFSRPRPRLHDPRPRPRLSFLSSRRLEIKALVSRTTSLDREDSDFFNSDHMDSAWACTYICCNCKRSVLTISTDVLYLADSVTYLKQLFLKLHSRSSSSFRVSYLTTAIAASLPCTLNNNPFTRNFHHLHHHLLKFV